MSQGWLRARKLTPADLETAPVPPDLLANPATELTVAGHLAVMLPMFAVYAAQSSGSHLGPIGGLLGQELPEEVGAWEGEPTDLIALLDMTRPEATTLTLRHRSATYDEAKLRGFGAFALEQMGSAFAIDLGEHWDREDVPEADVPEAERRMTKRGLTLHIVGRPEILCNPEGAATAVRLTFQARVSAVYTPKI